MTIHQYTIKLFIEARSTFLSLLGCVGLTTKRVTATVDTVHGTLTPSIHRVRWINHAFYGVQFASPTVIEMGLEQDWITTTSVTARTFAEVPFVSGVANQLRIGYV